MMNNIQMVSNKIIKQLPNCFVKDYNNDRVDKSESNHHEQSKHICQNFKLLSKVEFW